MNFEVPHDQFQEFWHENVKLSNQQLEHGQEVQISYPNSSIWVTKPVYNCYQH